MKSYFKVKGLDCAEEVAILKREVGPLVGDADRLTFNVLKGKMTVEHGAEVDSKTIAERVRRTGMEAIPWDAYEAKSQDGETKRGASETSGRAWMCGVSGGFLVLGFVVHAFSHGFVNALSSEMGYPVAVRVLYAVAAVAGAWYILPKAYYAARNLRPDMNLLMVVAASGAIVIGEWMEAAAVAFLFALALLLESWSVGRARYAIEALLDLSPRTARVRCPHDGDIEIKPIEDVPVGSEIIVHPGERIPLDGTIRAGATSVNQAAITGESIPVEKGPGDTVFAGSINDAGAFEFVSTKDADDTTLARIIHMVEEAESRRAPSQIWVDAFALRYTPAMMILALAIALVPPLLFGQEWIPWIYQALVILVIACPCALVISTPVTIVAGLAAAAREGVLIKGGAYLELPAKLKAIALDKTGTLTRGKPVVQEIVPLNGHTSAELLERAAALEARSEHPIAKAVLQKAEENGVTAEAATDYVAVAGKGASARINDRHFWIGSHRMLHEKGGETPECHDKAVALEDAGHSVLAIGNDTHVCGLISVADELRPDSKDALAALHDAGIEEITMLTGDNEGTASAVARELGLDRYYAEMLPEDKVAAVERLVEKYKYVAMVGDGVNDAPAMARSSLGVVMGAAGSDAAIETADVALMSDDLSKIAWLIRHSRRTMSIIKQNVFGALGTKLIFVVLALFGWATLWMAIAADMGASLLVILNGMRLLRARE